jgi:hypothetical protein
VSTADISTNAFACSSGSRCCKRERNVLRAAVSAEPEQDVLDVPFDSIA